MSLKSIVRKIGRRLDARKAKPNPDGRYILYDNGAPLTSDKLLLYVVHLTAGAPPSVIFDNMAIYEKLGFDIVMVITFSDRSLESVIALGEREFSGKRVLVRQNYGKDFGGFSDAMSIVPKEFTGKLVFQNDSLVGPLYDSDFVQKFINTAGEFVGVTESFTHRYHLQSSFLTFSGNGLVKLRKFFEHVYKIYNFRANIIHLGEIGLTQFLLSEGVEATPYFRQIELMKISNIEEENRPGYPLRQVNPQHFFAEAMFTQLDYPFIKREFLTVNEVGHPFSWRRILEKMDSDGMNKLRQSLASRT